MPNKRKQTLFEPKLITVLKKYNRADFKTDIRAGINVGIVALPLSIAFGVLSGLSPQEGLLAAIVAGFLTALLGGSRVQIAGPTGASAVMILGVLHSHGKEGLIVCTVLSGLLLVIFGLSRLGGLIKYIPRPLTVGFTSCIAVIIFSSQVKDLLGLQIAGLPAGFLEKWISYWQNGHTASLPAALIALFSIGIMTGWPRLHGKFAKSLPAPFVVLVVNALLVFAFKIPVETIGSKFGALKFAPQVIDLSLFSWPLIQEMLPTAFTIAILGAMVSLLSAVVGDGMIDGRHRSNTELIAQGFANIACGVLGGMPSQGAVARTVTNVKHGAKTPVAAMMHSFALLLILLIFGKAAAFVPLACLAGILVVVSYNMSEWRSVLSLLQSTRSDAAILITTFTLGVLTNLTLAMEAGFILTLLLFIQRMNSTTQFTDILEDLESEEELQLPQLPEGAEIYEVDGPLYFASAIEFLQTMRMVAAQAKVQILYLRRTNMIDASGLYVLKQFYRECSQAKITLVLAGIHTQPLRALNRSGLLKQIGRKNVRLKLGSAIARAEEILRKQKTV